MLDDYGWELYNAARFREAVRAGSAAAELYAGLGDSVALGSCLVRVSRHWFMAGETDAAEECAERAVRILEAAGDDAALAQADALPGRDPRPGRGSRAGRGPCCAAPATWRGRRSAWTSPCCA